MEGTLEVEIALVLEERLDVEAALLVGDTELELEVMLVLLLDATELELIVRVLEAALLVGDTEDVAEAVLLLDPTALELGVVSELVPELVELTMLEMRVAEPELPVELIVIVLCVLEETTED